MPFAWIWYRLRKHQETVTFAGDLDAPPLFDLDVRNHRWSGTCLSDARQLQATEKWSAQKLGTMIISTRKDWQHDIVNLMDAFSASRSYDFLKIAFRRQTPQFSATVALNAVEPDALAEMNVFDVIRELAASSSASAF